MTNRSKKISKVKAKKLIYVAIFLIALLNIIAYNHAYKFTHFDLEEKEKTKPADRLPLLDKFTILLRGIDNPRPENNQLPTRTWKDLKIKTHNGYTLDAWHIGVPNPQGIVLLFHGYGGRKSSLLKNSEAFNQFGYDTILVYFYGSGNSDGNSTTIGHLEGEDVRNVYNFVSSEYPSAKIVLYGFSMGAVAVLRSVAELEVKPEGIIIEAPYGRLSSSVENRFQLMGFPSFGLTQLLLFWGGVQHRYWPFSLDSMEYAKRIDTPTLILLGENDDRVDRDEVKNIYYNLQGEKKLVIVPNTKHNYSVYTHFTTWETEVRKHLNLLN